MILNKIKSLKELVNKLKNKQNSKEEHEKILDHILGDEAKKAEIMVIKHLELQGKILSDITDNPE